MPIMPLVDRRTRRRGRLAVGLMMALGCRPPPGPASPAATPTPPVEVVPAGPPALDALRLLGLLDELASDGLGGRYTLHPDIHRAAAAIIARYREAGVAAARDEGYLLDFEIMVGVDPGPGTALVVQGRGAPRTLDPAALLPLPEGTAGRAEGPLVFVGYGLEQAPPAPLDERTGVSLQGAVAVLLRGTPRRAPGSAAPPRTYGRAARDLGYKLERLAEAGAVAVIVVDDPGALERGVERDPPALPSPADDHPMRRRVEIPVLQVDASAARGHFRAQGRTLGARQLQIDREGEPRSGPLGTLRATVVVDAQPRMARAPNILAMVPGTDRADEIVLVGAHYDHLGTEAPGHGPCRHGTRSAADRICNGADDNASGSAVVAELAQAMAAGPAPRRTVVFVHFSGEELGLLGSRDLAARLDHEAPFAGRRVVAMLNVDMVGRLRERLTVSGVGSSAGWMELLDDVGPHGMRVLYDRSLTRRSDHAPFYERGIPALFFFTELHDDYHAPSDEAAKILPQGLMRVASMIAEITWRLADGYALPFREPATPAEGLVRALPGNDPSTIVKIVGPDGTPES